MDRGPGGSGRRHETQRLIALRRGAPALHAPVWVPLAAAPEGPLLAYLRTDAAGDQPVVVLLNFSAAAVEATVAVPAPLSDACDGPLVDLWSGDPIPRHTESGLPVSIPGWGFRLVARGRG